MIKDIVDKYKSANNALIETAGLFTEDKFFKRPAENKWSAAENIEHLVLVTKPMVALFTKPEVMVERWGTVERPSRSYDEIAGAYMQVTNGAGKAPERAVPQDTEQTQAAELNKFKQVNDEFFKTVELLTDSQLNTYQVPHPFIGNITVKECLHFMTFHVTHHHKAITEILKSFN
jgi:DinB superfamily